MIIKTVATLLLAIAIYPVSAQIDEVHFLVSLIHKDSFEGWEPESQAKINKLRQVVSAPEFSTVCLSESSKPPGESINNFHWVDLNQDGFEDIVYSGACLPYVATEFFLFNNNSYSRVFGISGAVVELKEDATQTTIYTSMMACCCEDYNLINLIKILPKTNEIKKARLYWHSETQIDAVAFTFEPFRTTGSIAIRTHPRINNKIQIWECDDESEIFGNRTIQFNKGVAGYILHRKKVRGKTWGLVLIMPNDKNMKTTYLEQRFKAGETYSLGWTEINENLQLTSK